MSSAAAASAAASAVSEWLSGSGGASVALRWASVQRLYQGKLWHQLGEEVQALANEPFFTQPQHLLRVYTEFLQPLEARLNHTLLASIATQATLFLPADEGIAFLNSKLAPKAPLASGEAKVLIQSRIASLMLQTTPPQTKEAKALIDSVRKDLDMLQGAASSVHAGYYRAALDYYRRVGPAAKLYSSAMAFLQYASLDALDARERVELAQTVALAAITGDKVYAFSELAMHPIVASLAGTPLAWLASLLRVLSVGDIGGYQELMRSNEAGMAQHAPSLLSSRKFVEEKLRLLALQEFVFQRPSHERAIGLGELAERMAVPLLDVELYVMRAISLGLIKGSIDEVQQKVNVTWVQPRALDQSQAAALREKLRSWRANVRDALHLVSEESKELTA